MSAFVPRPDSMIAYFLVGYAMAQMTATTAMTKRIVIQLQPHQVGPSVAPLQRCTKWYASIVKHYAGKVRQKSLATSVTNFIRLKSQSVNVEFELQIRSPSCSK